MSAMKTPFLLQVERVVEGKAVWVTLATLWGRKERRSETGRYNRIEKATHEITIRRRTDLAIEAGMRLSEGVQGHLIVAVQDDDPERRWMTLLTQDIGSLD